MDMKIALVAVAALLVAAGCGGGEDGGGDAAATSSSSDPGVKYAECMRENGVPEFPDPVNGRLTLRAGPGSGIRPDSPEFQQAQEACRSLAPQGAQAGGRGNEEMQARVLEYAGCMRENGVPDFPDPDFSGQGVRMRLPQGVDENSPQFQAAQQECQPILAQQGGAP
jgi:hypothetical protein